MTTQDALLRGALAQQQAQQQLTDTLKHTLNQPASIHRLNVSIVGLGQDGANRVLMIALPTGERIDVPMSGPQAMSLGRQLSALPGQGSGK